MTPPVATAMSPRSTAELLRRVAAEKHPRLALPTIASNRGMLLADLQTILKRNGYPDVAAMRASARRLDAVADEPADQATAGGDAPTAAQPGDHLQTVRLVDLHVDPDNVRDDARADIEDLAESMSEVGLVQPIVARRDGDRLVIVAGHRRYAAAKHLQWVDIEVIVRGPMRPDHVIAAMLIENGQRKDLDPIEEARGLRRLKVETGCSDLELARKVGRSQPHVSGRLALLDLTPEEQAQIRTGELTLTNAVARGRLNSGRVGKTGVDRDWHLGPTHDLADQAKARCQKLKHKQGRRVGGTPPRRSTTTSRPPNTGKAARRQAFILVGTAALVLAALEVDGPLSVLLWTWIAYRAFMFGVIVILGAEISNELTRRLTTLPRQWQQFLTTGALPDDQPAWPSRTSQP